MIGRIYRVAGEQLEIATTILENGEREYVCYALALAQKRMWPTSNWIDRLILSFLEGCWRKMIEKALGKVATYEGYVRSLGIIRGVQRVDMLAERIKWVDRARHRLENGGLLSGLFANPPVPPTCAQVPYNVLERDLLATLSHADRTQVLHFMTRHQLISYLPLEVDEDDEDELE